MDDNRQSKEHADFDHEASRRGLRTTGSNTMGWDTDHHDFPRNWSAQRKIYDGCLMLFLELYTAVISSMGPSAAEEAMSKYAMSRRFDNLQSKVGEVDMDIPNPDKIKSTEEFFKVVLVRPAKLGVREPIIILVATLNASSWGMVFLFTESFTVVYGDFGFSSRATSLPFVALLPGIMMSGLVRFWDRHKLNARQKANQTPEPEDKIGGFAIAAPALAAGLWIFGWTVPPIVHVHWIASMFGRVLVGFAATEFSYTLSGYTADSYTIYASSGMAVTGVLRALAQGCLPLFAYPMYSGLGSNVATSIIAAVATVFCITPYIFLKHGKRLREKSPFARYSAKVNEEHSAD